MGKGGGQDTCQGSKILKMSSVLTFSRKYLFFLGFTQIWDGGGRRGGGKTFLRGYKCPLPLFVQPLQFTFPLLPQKNVVCLNIISLNLSTFSCIPFHIDIPYHLITVLPFYLCPPHRSYFHHYSCRYQKFRNRRYALTNFHFKYIGLQHSLHNLCMIMHAFFFLHGLCMPFYLFPLRSLRFASSFLHKNIKLHDACIAAYAYCRPW